MNDFEKYFNETILPKYHTNRYADDYDLAQELPHSYRIPITERLDLTHLRCYTIDPPGCTDPDDGFSIWTDSSQKSWLAIHIADPTAYFTPESECFKATLEGGVTHYPSGHKPLHLMPAELVEKASLKKGHKLAISVIIEIVDNYPVGEARIAFTKVLCDSKWSYTYETALNRGDEEGEKDGEDNDSTVFLEDRSRHDFERCIRIGNTMRSMRESVGKKLSKLGISYTRNLKAGTYQLTHQDMKTTIMKQMIAEFAIFANSAVAYYLHRNLSMGIFRICDSGGELGGLSESSDIDSTDLLALITDKGVTAEYLNIMKSHDLVGLPSYCHFTSPIRRAVDCICHFLLKSAYLGVNPPFTQDWLASTSQKLDILTRMERKLQFLDKKLRTFQAIHHRLQEKGKVRLGVRITGYTGLFLNIILDKVDDFEIQVSYVIRVGKDFPLYHSFFKNNLKHSLMISRVNVPKKFDEGTIPELDNFVRTGTIV